MESLAAYLDPGWYGPEVSAYVHRGRVYLTAYVENEPPAAGQTVLAGIPAHLRPSSPVSLVLPIRADLTDDICNPSLNLPILWAATIHPDGSLILDTEVSKFVNEPPPVGEWFYEDEEGPHPQYTTPFRLAIALGNASWPVGAEPDAPVFTSAAAEVGGEFANAGAEFALHGSRVHLGGGVRAVVDEGITVLKPLPPGSAAALPPLLGDITTATLLGDPIALGVDAATGLNILSDAINPIEDSARLRGSFPPRGYFSRLSGQTPTTGSGEVQGKVEFTGGINECEIETGCNKPTGMIVKCKQALERGGDLSVSMAPLLEMCHPLPDFYLITYGILVTGGDIGRDHGCAYATGFCSGIPPIIARNVSGCLPAPEASPNVAIAAHPPLFLVDGTPAPEQFPSGIGPTVGTAGYLRPPVSHYKGLPHEGEIGDSGLLWTPAQATTVSGACDAVVYYSAVLEISLHIIPFYERREVGIHAGELLDLSHTGWEGAGLEIGDSRSGRVPSLHTVGRRG